MNLYAVIESSYFFIWLIFVNVCWIYQTILSYVENHPTIFFSTFFVCWMKNENNSYEKRKIITFSVNHSCCFAKKHCLFFMLWFFWKLIYFYSNSPLNKMRLSLGKWFRWAKWKAFLFVILTLSVSGMTLIFIHPHSHIFHVVKIYITQYDGSWYIHARLDLNAYKAILNNSNSCFALYASFHFLNGKGPEVPRTENIF